MFDGHDQADFDRKLLDFVKAPVDYAILYSIPLMTTRQIKENIIKTLTVQPKKPLVKTGSELKFENWHYQRLFKA